MAAGAEALEVHGIGEEEPIDAGRKYIMHFEGTSGYLEGHPAGPIQLGKQLRPSVRSIGEPEVPFFVSVSGLRIPLTAMDIPRVQIQADVARHRAIPPFAFSVLERRMAHGSDHGTVHPPVRAPGVTRPGSCGRYAGRWPTIRFDGLEAQEISRRTPRLRPAAASAHVAEATLPTLSPVSFRQSAWLQS